MRYLGDFPIGAKVYIYFDTFDGGTGASITMSGFLTSDIEVYKNGSAVQRASDTGFALIGAGTNFDTTPTVTTGVHGFSIDTASNATAGFFTAGSDYMVLVDSVSIDGQTVRFIAATFSIENRRVAGELCRSTISALTNQTSFTLTAGTASGDADAYVGCTAIISDVVSGIQKCVGYISGYTAGGIVTLAFDPGIFTIAIGDNITILANSRFADVRAVSGTVQTAADVPALITTVDTVVDAIKVDTAATLIDTAEIGAAGAGLTVLSTAAALTSVASDVTTIANDVANIDGSKIFPVDSADLANIPFVFVSSEDHATPVTDATGITVTRSLNGAGFAAADVATTVTEMTAGNGAYHIDANSADMAGPIIVFRVAATGGSPAVPDAAFVTVITDAL
jgi:hypothetical protein